MAKSKAAKKKRAADDREKRLSRDFPTRVFMVDRKSAKKGLTKGMRPKAERRATREFLSQYRTGGILPQPKTSRVVSGRLVTRTRSGQLRMAKMQELRGKKSAEGPNQFKVARRPIDQDALSPGVSALDRCKIPEDVAAEVRHTFTDTYPLGSSIRLGDSKDKFGLTRALRGAKPRRVSARYVLMVGIEQKWTYKRSSILRRVFTGVAANGFVDSLARRQLTTDQTFELQTTTENSDSVTRTENRKTVTDIVNQVDKSRSLSATVSGGVQAGPFSGNASVTGTLSASESAKNSLNDLRDLTMKSSSETTTSSSATETISTERSELSELREGGPNPVADRAMINVKDYVASVYSVDYCLSQADVLLEIQIDEIAFDEAFVGRHRELVAAWLRADGDEALAERLLRSSPPDNPLVELLNARDISFAAWKWLMTEEWVFVGHPSSFSKVPNNAGKNLLKDSYNFVEYGTDAALGDGANNGLGKAISTIQAVRWFHLQFLRKDLGVSKAKREELLKVSMVLLADAIRPEWELISAEKLGHVVDTGQRTEALRRIGGFLYMVDGMLRPALGLGPPTHGSDPKAVFEVLGNAAQGKLSKGDVAAYLPMGQGVPDSIEPAAANHAAILAEVAGVLSAEPGYYTDMYLASLQDGPRAPGRFASWLRKGWTTELNSLLPGFSLMHSLDGLKLRDGKLLIPVNAVDADQLVEALEAASESKDLPAYLEYLETLLAASDEVVVGDGGFLTQSISGSCVLGSGVQSGASPSVTEFVVGQ